MEIEKEDENGLEYNPPKSSEYEATLKVVASSINSDFLSFDTNGYEFISSSIIPPIPTNICAFPLLEAYHTLEIIGKYGSGKSTLVYSIIANVVSASCVGGMEMGVFIFDLDTKLQVSTLLQCILSKHSGITDEKEQIRLYKEAIDRVTVYRPNDICHFSLILSSLLTVQSKRPRLLVVESLSSYLYDLGTNDLSQTLFKSILIKLKQLLKEFKSSLILISPKVLNKSSSFYYMPIAGWFSFIHHRLFLKKLQMEGDVVYELVNLEEGGTSCRFLITEFGLSFM